MRRGIRRAGPDALMLGGLAGAMAGIYLLLGLGWVLLLGGLVIAGAGLLLDLGWL